MKPIKLIGIGLAIIICQSFLLHDCYAVNWQHEIRWKNKMIFYIDTESVQLNQKINQIKFWYKAVSPYGYDTCLMICNYKEKSYVIIKINSYDNNGKLTESSSFEPSKAEKQYISGGVMEIILNEALSSQGIRSTKE